jgi:hypothetical protein
LGIAADTALLIHEVNDLEVGDPWREGQRGGRKAACCDDLGIDPCVPAVRLSRNCGDAGERLRLFSSMQGM